MQVCPRHLKESINQEYLKQGTNEQVVGNLGREMKLNGVEAKESLVKTQMTVVVKQQFIPQNITTPT